MRRSNLNVGVSDMNVCESRTSGRTSTSKRSRLRKWLVPSILALICSIIGFYFLKDDFELRYRATYLAKTASQWTKEFSNEDLDRVAVLRAFDHFDSVFIAHLLLDTAEKQPYNASKSYKWLWKKLPGFAQQRMRSPIDVGSWRLDILDSLRYLDTRGRHHAAPRLLKLLSNTNEYLWFNTIVILGQLEVRSPEVCNALLEKVKSEPRHVALSAASALVNLDPGNEELALILIEWLKKEQGDLRFRAQFKLHTAEMLGKMGSTAQSALPVLRKLTDDPHEGVSVAAELSVENIEKELIRVRNETQ